MIHDFEHIVSMISDPEHGTPLRETTGNVQQPWQGRIRKTLVILERDQKQTGRQCIGVVVLYQRMIQAQKQLGARPKYDVTQCVIQQLRVTRGKRGGDQEGLAGRQAYIGQWDRSQSREERKRRDHVRRKNGTTQAM